MTNISQDFIQHISQQLNDSEAVQALLDFSQKPLRKSIRINSLRADKDALLKEWQQAGYQLEPIPWCSDGFWINEEHKALPEGFGNFLPHLAGQFYIQEASSMLPVMALFASHPEPNMVLDVAAAPGSKTTQIAAQMNNRGLVLANELSASRIKALYANLERTGVSNGVLCHYDGRQFGELTPETFDAILLDAPCGGEGTVRKDPDALSSWSLDSVLSMSELQKELIISAFKALKPGGTLVYSTCTLSKEENQLVCQHLLDTYPDKISTFPLDALFSGADKVATEEGYLHVYPHLFDSEGFFVACFRKNEAPIEEELALDSDLGSRFPFTKLAKKDYSELAKHCAALGWSLDSIKQQLWQRANEIWYFPAGIEKLIGKLRMDRIGVKLAESHRSGYRLQHQAITAFGPQLSQQTYELNDQQAVEYYQGRDISIGKTSALKKGEVAIRYQGVVIGLAKNLGNKLKNSLPRYLVNDTPFAEL
ncbi:16S rRNA (cytosine(1407)-C(5))-methyltransferase RsmF [Kangiella sp.]|uniref:16S rRNA (cytosine(1407)-C(5))-methyltransferase RsmF n=1 Tax=Kangiella sp. TaxID=1920245 RepID=UPI0019CB1ED3|nr:16S rRNA (cytosine(1407)-C(5))-methyltransferase RsmF [Kangiella sp.]MBD3653895.1 16S rRNA (cytosine(1407)-C(5))-methyltransferase RsmF [Kangiella sp.]